MSERTPTHDVEALLALAITRQRLVDACPDLEEIAAWHEGGLTPQRREAVTHHVAHCDACFEVWTGLLDSADLLGATAPGAVAPTGDVRTRRRRWLPKILPTFGTGSLAAGFALVFMLAILVPILQQPSLEARLETGFEEIARTGAVNTVGEQWPWPAGFQSRNVAGAEPDEQLAARAFRAGLAAGLEGAVPATAFWKETVAALTDEVEPCEGADTPAGCQAISSVLFTAGRWAALLHLACEASARSPTASSGGLSGEFWSGQADVLGRLDETIGSTLPDSSFSRLFGQWHAQLRQASDAPTTLCARSSTLITLGLGS